MCAAWLAAGCLLAGAAPAQTPWLAPGVPKPHRSLAENQELADVARTPLPTDLAGPQAGGENEMGARSSDAARTLVSFGTGSAQLTPGGTRGLDELGRTLAERGPDIRLLVEGFADTVGKPDANRDLAQRRARAVAAYLEQNCGLEPGRVHVRASRRLLVSTADQVAEARNRRVLVIVNP